MNITSFYPVLGTDKLQESRDFYLKYLLFTETFHSDWYVSLRSNSQGFELALLDYTHESVPEGFRRKTQGLILNIEIENVDDVYTQFRNAGLQIHLDLRSEDWGQRHFITSDPNGILLDLIQVIPPSAEFANLYSE